MYKLGENNRTAKAMRDLIKKAGRAEERLQRQDQLQSLKRSAVAIRVARLELEDHVKKCILLEAKAQEKLAEIEKLLTEHQG